MKLPVSPEDYFVHEISHPNTKFAIVKANRRFFGEAYVLPFEKTQDFVEIALSDDFAKKYYPVGRPKPQKK